VEATPPSKKIRVNRPAASGVREEEGPFRRVRLNAWLGYSRCELECDSIANSISATILRRSLESLDQHAAISFNDPAGSGVVWICRNLDVLEPFSASMLQHQFQR